MDEVFKYQESITDSMKHANDKYSEIDKSQDLDQTLARLKDYHEKIVNLKLSLSTLREKSAKLRRRSNKILDHKIKEDIERQRSRLRREMFEKHLEPVVNTRRD